MTWSLLLGRSVRVQPVPQFGFMCPLQAHFLLISFVMLFFFPDLFYIEVRQLPFLLWFLFFLPVDIGRFVSDSSLLSSGIVSQAVSDVLGSPKTSRLRRISSYSQLLETV